MRPEESGRGAQECVKYQYILYTQSRYILYTGAEISSFHFLIWEGRLSIADGSCQDRPEAAGGEP